jgi:hypothetical protein
MVSSKSLYHSFNTGLERRRADPTKGGPPDIDDTTNHGTALLCGIAELGYRSRKGLPLTCHWQGDNDPFWITEMLKDTAHHLGHHLLPAVDDLHDAFPDEFVDGQVTIFYKRVMEWIERAQAIHNALSEHGVAPENAAWFSDDSELYDLVHEFLNLFQDAQRLDSQPRAAYPFRIRPTTVPPCQIP